MPLQLNATTVAELIETLVERRPELWDIIHPNDPPVWGRISSYPESNLWRSLNPQPLPWRIALTLADAHISEILSLERTSTLLGSEAGQRALDRSLRIVAEIDDICPRWPWPKHLWPPPPPPPPWLNQEMTAPELFVFGTRFLAVSKLSEQAQLQQALVSLGEKALTLSMRGGG